jgi:lipid-A-disaccharide synthase
MRIFFSVGEPSGDIHGANLIRELKALDPTIECVGYGGEKMAAAGANLHFPLVQLSVMWFARVLANITTFLSLASKADRYFRHHRPDAVVLIDYPGFNWWIARRAKFHGIPVFYFVPPQLWGWAGWRVEKVRRFVDHVLCTLPFEKQWYADRGVDATYVGHPFFDECPRQQLDEAFLSQQRADGARLIALLPGSRTQEVERNWETLYRAARTIHESRPDVRFLVPSFKPTQQKMVDDFLASHPPLPIRTYVGKTPEIIELAEACLSVSGSVALELLYRLKPTCILYRIGKLDLRVARFFMKTQFICLVNKLANKELYPEFLTDRDESQQLANHALRWLNDEAAFAEAKRELTELKHRYAMPGACSAAAAYITKTLQPTHSLTPAASS